MFWIDSDLKNCAALLNRGISRENSVFGLKTGGLKNFFIFFNFLLAIFTIVEYSLQS